MRTKFWRRIYPSKSSNIYDKYFPPTRQLHKVVHRILFSDEYFTLARPPCRARQPTRGAPRTSCLPRSLRAASL